MSGSPAFTSVASWRVNCVRTFVLMRPCRNFGSLMLIWMFLFRPPPFFAGAFAGFAPFFAAGAAAAAPLTSPRAVGRSPCARTAEIAALRSPASTVPRRSAPEESFAMYWNVAMVSFSD